MSVTRQHAIEIWNAGVDAVRAEPLLRRAVKVDAGQLQIDHRVWRQEDYDRILVVGGGKAGSAMAAGLLHQIRDWLPVTGWINVPAGTELDLPAVTTHPARPAGVNEPTKEGVFGVEQILRIVESAGPRDLCIALISGGGSALLPAPVEGITLADKLQVTKFLSAAGADITELNTVRKHLSRIKGGRLLRACRARCLITLVLSDVLGDPLDMIASGPTVPDPTTPDQALSVLRKYDRESVLPGSVYQVLSTMKTIEDDPEDLCASELIVIGNNAVAVDEAGLRAESLGYNHAMQSAQACEGAAEEVGQRLAEMTVEMLRAGHTQHRTDCLITGGEPTVLLADPAIRGRGGRNQQLVLAAYHHLLGAGLTDEDWSRLAILSGGTDGEDGPTDAAGAVLDAEVHRRAAEFDLDVVDHPRRNDAYSFFERCGGLLITGPTGTNVCDVRVVVIDKI